jgi:hypothetical protein
MKRLLPTLEGLLVGERLLAATLVVDLLPYCLPALPVLALALDEASLGLSVLLALDRELLLVAASRVSSCLLVALLQLSLPLGELATLGVGRLREPAGVLPKLLALALALDRVLAQLGVLLLLQLALLGAVLTSELRALMTFLAALRLVFFPPLTIVARLRGLKLRVWHRGISARLLRRAVRRTHVGAVRALSLDRSGLRRQDEPGGRLDRDGRRELR